jgi:hypothetical protein
MEIATTILNQLGGKRFIVMTGSKNFVTTKNGGLLMKLSRNASGAQYLKIELNGSDLYEMNFFSVRGIDIKQKAEFSGVYCDQLTNIFESVTGLYTSF